MNAPLVAVVRQKGLTNHEAEQAAVSVMRTMVRYLPEPVVTRVRDRLSRHMQRKVDSGDFAVGNRYAPSGDFFRLVAEEGKYPPERARELTLIVVDAWSRQVPPDLLEAVAGYMPAVIQVLLPGRPDLVTPQPEDPLKGALIPLCTAPKDPAWTWHKIGATFGHSEWDRRA